MAALRNARLCGGLPDWVRDLARSGNRMNVERGRLGGWRALVAEVAANEVEGHYLQRVTRWRQPAQVVLGAREPVTIFQQQDTALPAEARIQLLDFRMDLAEGIPPRLIVRAWRRALKPAPLLDMEVVRLAWRLPQHLKYHDGEHKRILKHLLARYLPEPLVYRPKRGFGPPMARWLAGAARLGGGAAGSAAAAQSGLLRCGARAWCLGGVPAGERKWHTHLWNVLMFQAWHQHWHGGRGR